MKHVILVTLCSFFFCSSVIADRFWEVGLDEKSAKSYTEFLEKRTASDESHRNHFFVDKTFSEPQKKMLERAVAKYFYRRDKKDIRKCALSRATRYTIPVTAGSNETADEALASITRAMGSGSVYILRVDGATYNQIVGVGWVGIIDRSKSSNKFYIALNSDYMNGTYIHGNNYHYWSSVIAHELAHNGGYRHPDGYEGTLIQAYDECIFLDRSGNFSDEFAAASGALPMPSRAIDVVLSPHTLTRDPK